MIKLLAFTQKYLYYNVGNNSVSLKSWKYCFQHRWGYELQNFPETVPPAPRLITVSYLPAYRMKRIALASSQGLALLAFFPYPLSCYQSLINGDIFISMIRRWSSNVLWFWAIHVPKSDPKNEFGSLCS